MRTDTTLPEDFPYGELEDNKNTNTAAFLPFMLDRERIGRLKDSFESRIGTAQGLSPLTDGM